MGAVFSWFQVRLFQPLTMAREYSIISARFLQGMFWAQEMEIAILGLQNAGKSSFVNVINRF